VKKAPSASPSRFQSSILFASLVGTLCGHLCVAQPSGSPVRGLIYYAVEELDNSRIVLQGTAGSQGVVFDRLILAPNTRYQAWLLHAETLRVADVTFTTPGAGQPFRFPDSFTWGAHAPSRAVFRPSSVAGLRRVDALAEHHSAFECNQRSVTARPLDRAARAPLGTREGACAPRDGGMSV